MKRCKMKDHDEMGCVRPEGHAGRHKIRRHPDREFAFMMDADSDSSDPYVATVALSRCRACGSTDREGYYGVRVLQMAGAHEGEPYTHIVWRRTRCRCCGQMRVDRSYEHRRAD
jgi:hypothetical protein